MIQGGIGALKIEEDHIRGLASVGLIIFTWKWTVVGRSEFEKPVQISQLSSADV